MERKQRIFIAEDESHLAGLMKTALESGERYHVTLFADGLELYQSLQEKPPQLLILDILIPSLSGMAIARLSKFHRDLRAIPVILISGIQDEGIRDRAMQAGADLFLPKPFGMEELSSAVNELLSH